MFDVDKGIKGSVIHHKPLNELQLKRLLLLFDEINFTDPADNKFFLEKGSICYRYKIERNQKILYSLDGHKLLQAHKHVKEPEIPTGSLAMASVLNRGGKPGEAPFQAIILSDVLPYFKGVEFENEENKLFEKFERAINKEHIKILDYKSTDFNLRNAISLKIAYDFDVSDPKSVELLKALFVDEESKKPDMFIPSPSFPELTNFEYFPRANYISHFGNEKEKHEIDYETQFFSIVGKINKKLALAENFNLMPIIIDDNIHKYYQYKINKSKNNIDKNFKQEWDKTYTYELMNLNNLLFKSSNIFIENEQLQVISIPEILSYKDKCLNELYKLRKDLFTDINEIISTNFNSSDISEVNKLIGKKIIPEYNKYQELQNGILSDTIKNIVRYGVAFGSAYFGFVQGLSPALISLLSGSSPLLAENILQLSDKLIEKKKRKYENTFSYFLNLSEKK